MLHAPLPRTLEAALRDASDPKRSVRVSAARDLGRYAAPSTDDDREREVPAGEVPGSATDRERALDALLVALSDPDAPVREAAAEALADAHAPSSLAPLLVAVEDDDPLVRQKAIAALGELGDPRAQQRLERALDDARPEVRFQAVMAFPRVVARAADANAAIARAASDADEHVAYIALRMAEEIAERAEAPIDEAVLERARDLVKRGSPRLRAVAAILLAATGDRSGSGVIESLVRGELTTDEPEDLAEAILLAGDLALERTRKSLERRAFRRFLGLMRDPFAWHARTALARLGDVRAAGAILDDLRTGPADRAALAASAAARARLVEARPLIEALRERHPSLPIEIVDRALCDLDAPSPLARRSAP